MPGRGERIQVEIKREGIPRWSRVSSECAARPWGWGMTAASTGAAHAQAESSFDLNHGMAMQQDRRTEGQDDRRSSTQTAGPQEMQSRRWGDLGQLLRI